MLQFVQQNTKTKTNSSKCHTVNTRRSPRIHPVQRKCSKSNIHGKKKKCTEVQDQRLLALRFLLYRLKLSYIVTSRKQKLIIHIYKKEVIENTVLVQSVEFQLKKR